MGPWHFKVRDEAAVDQVQDVDGVAQTLTCLVAQGMERVGRARGRRWGGGG